MRYFILTAVAMIGLMMASCIEDGITTSPQATLTFSRDTVNFDTVFTDLGTPTARLIVSNRSKKGVNISSIRFKRADTEFSLNVDGVSGSEFHDVEIRGRDSIYIFIECFIPATESASPGLTADDLEFVTNGVTQDVRVEAYGMNVTRLRAMRVDTDLTLTADRPYVIFDSLYVAKGATLNIDEGAQLLFHDGASLVIDGRLQAKGAPGKMIHMRGDRLDNVLPDVSYDIMAGQWRGVRFGADSYENQMEYVDMRSTTSGLYLDSCADMSRNRLTLVNSWLHNSQKNALTAYYSNISAYGCCFSEASNSAVALTGGSHIFSNCTFSNYYLFSAINGTLVELDHLFDSDIESTLDTPTLPLMTATFENCILYGLGSELNHGDLTGSQVFFRYCSLGALGEDDDNFLNCLWDTDPMFLTDRESYYFNYRLQADSPVRSAGNPAFVTDLTLIDMDGVNRLGQGNPSLGAYQYTDRPASRPQIR